MYKFRPLLKSTLWGGEKISKLKHTDTGMHQVGESWEISGVAGDETIVCGGQYDGMPLNSLVSELGPALLGEANYQRFGNEFPLLVKFIDARDDLSIQVHPNDETAHRLGKPRGKTEMWYAMECEPGAQLYNGLGHSITPAEYKDMVAQGTICDALKRYNVSEGDVFFIPAGRIHAIGKGCFVAEIQQTSDVTYRIFDFNRVDKDGHHRQLHTHEAAESIDYRVLDDYRTLYKQVKNNRMEVVRCPYFTTSIYDIDTPQTIDYSSLDSFVILIGVKGKGTVTDDTGQSTCLCAGESILMPATNKSLRVEGNVRFLETFIG